MEDKLMNGRVRAMAHKRGVANACFNKYFDIIGERRKISIIKIALNSKIKNAVEKIIFLALILFSLTSFEILIGREKEARVIKRE